MKCPNCGGQYDAPHRYCGKCGSLLEPEETGSHRWPLIILMALALAGLLLWFAMPRTYSEPVPYTTAVMVEQSL